MPIDIPPRNILAFDPGGTTGYAVAGERFYAGELHGDFETQALAMSELFYKYTPGFVVCETYTITQRTAHLSQQPEALMLIGMVRWFVSRTEATLTMQKPSVAKSFATDAKLREMTWFSPTTGGHANDATRHLLTWMASNGKLDNETLKRLVAA